MKPKKNHPWKSWSPGFFKSKPEDKVTAVLKGLQFARAFNRGYIKAKKGVLDASRNNDL